MELVKAEHDHVFQEFHAARLVEMATDALMGFLLCADSLQSERKRTVAQVFLQGATLRTQANLACIQSRDRTLLEGQKAILNHVQ